MTDGSIGTPTEILVGHVHIDKYAPDKADELKADRKEPRLPDVWSAWFGSNASYANRMAFNTLEQVINACKLNLPQDWKMRPNRRLVYLKSTKSREAVLDSARRWFHRNGITMRGLTDDGVFNCFSTAMNSELKLTSSRHGVSRKWYDYLQPDLPSLSAYLSVGRQLAWEKECLRTLNRLLGKTGHTEGQSGAEGKFDAVTSMIDSVVCTTDFDGKRQVNSFSAGRLVEDIDPQILQMAAACADKTVKAMDAPGLAETEMSVAGSEQGIVKELESVSLKIGTTYAEAIENWQPYYDENGNVLAAHPLIRIAQFSQSWEFDMRTQTLTVNQTSKFEDRDAVDQFLQQLILDVSSQQWHGDLPTEILEPMSTTFNLGGAHFNSSYGVDNSLFYSILELQQTQEAMMDFAIAKQNWEASAPVIEWGRQELIKEGRATDLLDERLAIYSSVLKTAYFNMMLCLLHLGPVNILRGDIIQPHYLPVENFSLGIQLNTPSGMFIMDDGDALWDDRFGRF